MTNDDSKPIEIRGEDSPPRTRWKPPPNYLARSTRWRLWLLTAALMLVLVLMREAGNPENWAWMGFDDPKPVADGQSGSEGNAATDLETGPYRGFAETDDQPLAADVTSLPGKLELADYNAGYNVWRQQIWHEAFLKLTTEQRRQLFSLLYFARGKAGSPRGQPSEWPTLAVTIEKLIHHRLTYEWNQLSNKDHLEPEQLESFSEWTIALRDEWSSELAPVLARAAGGEPATSDDQLLLERFVRVLAPAAWSLVSDHTPVARPVEGPAWLIAWEQVLMLKPDASCLAPTIFDLLSKPHDYRARPVQVRGTVQLVERIDVPRNDLGIDHYFALWIKPQQRSQTPYCVYVLEWPGKSPELHQRWIEVQQPVSLTAVFFKIRTYQSRDEQLVACPLLFAGTAMLDTSADGESSPGLVRDHGHPWNWAAILLLPLLAGWIAWRVYCSTRHATRPISPYREQHISETLERLADDPRIKSAREDIAEFKRMQRE